MRSISSGVGGRGAAAGMNVYKRPSSIDVLAQLNVACNACGGSEGLKTWDESVGASDRGSAGNDFCAYTLQG